MTNPEYILFRWILNAQDSDLVHFLEIGKLSEIQAISQQNTLLNHYTT